MPSDSAGKRKAPRIIGPYQLLKRIGAGGMGTVFRARHLHLGREVALKVLPPNLADKPELLARFSQEAKNAAKLRHEHIVTLYEQGEDDGLHYLAMEYVEGKNLHQYIDEQVRLDPEEARQLMIQAARALDLAHQEGIIHRDIKPSNFILTEKDGKPFVKLTDFGLARSMDDVDYKVTRSGTTVGTVDYIAPEQARNSRSADIRSDIYALGCTFYHMLAGQVPFPEGDMTERLLKHVEAAAEDVRKFNPKVPPGMVVVLNRMMAKRPEDRQQTPQELLQDLEHLPSGPVLSPRELLEALALDSGRKPKPRPSHETKGSPAESTSLLSQPLLPGELPKLRYRHARVLAKKARDLEGSGNHSWMPLAIQGWRAWTVIGSCLVVVLGIVLAVTLGLDKDALIQKNERAAGTPAAERVKEIAAVRSEEQNIQVDANDRLISSLDPSKKQADEGLKPRGDTTKKSRPSRQPSFKPPVFQPPPEQLASLEKQFQGRAKMGGQSDQKSASRTLAPPQTTAAATKKGPGTDASTGKPPDSASGEATPESPARRPKPSGPIYIVSRAVQGGDGRHFDSLKTACAAAANRDGIIELHDNGPIFESPLSLTGGHLMIRAGPGFRPLLVWDRLPSSRANHFISGTNLNLTLENLDFVAKISDPGQDEHSALVRLEGGELDVENCTFAMAGRSRAGSSAVQLDPLRGEPSGRCRLVHCLVRAAEAVAVDVRAAGADVTLDGCLFVCTNRPVVEIAAKAAATPTRLRIARSTLVGGQGLFRLRPATPADRQPAVHWLLWDTLLGHCGNAGGDLLDLQQGVGTAGMQWRAVNCLYSGWSTLLRQDSGGILQNQLEIWRKLWNNDEGEKVALETWPAVVPPDPCETPAAAFRVVGTHASFADSTGAHTLGCDVGLLPPARDNWLAITYEKTIAPALELPTTDQAPTIPEPGDGRYHGEQLDLTNINLGDYLRDLEKRRSFGPRVVLRLRGRGEVRTCPIHVKGSSLVLYFEPPEEGKERPVLVPKNVAGREALIDVEGGSCELVGGKIRFPNARNLPVPQYVVKVQGGHLYVVGCHLEGSLDQAPNSYHGLIHFSGSGEPAPDQAQECALADSILLSGLSCVHVANPGTRLRLQNCALVSATEAFYLEPGSASAEKLNVQCILERNTIAARHAAFRLADAVQPPSPIDPLVVQAKGNVFLDLFKDPQRRAGLLTYEGESLSHGLMVWQGEGNVYDKQFQFYAAPYDQQLANAAQPVAKWSQLWGSLGDRRMTVIDPAVRALDPGNLQLERLAVPELSSRHTSRGPLPGADLEQLGIVKKSRKK